MTARNNRKTPSNLRPALTSRQARIPLKGIPKSGAIAENSRQLCPMINENAAAQGSRADTLDNSIHFLLSPINELWMETNNAFKHHHQIKVQTPLLTGLDF